MLVSTSFYCLHNCKKLVTKSAGMKILTDKFVVLLLLKYLTGFISSISLMVLREENFWLLCLPFF